jgi:hypothetical protein
MNAIKVFLCCSVPDDGMSLMFITEELAQLRELASRAAETTWPLFWFQSYATLLGG